MIYLINPPDNSLRPALVAGPNLALPIYDEAWGTSYPIQNWQAAGLDRPSHIVLSQPLNSFRRRRHLGTLDVEERTHLRRKINLYRPALRAEMTLL